jgi:hypothetical protein
MLSREDIVKELARLEKRIAWLKEQLAPRQGARKRPVALAGKFPQLSTLTDTQLDEATHLWEHEFERDHS